MPVAIPPPLVSLVSPMAAAAPTVIAIGQSWCGGDSAEDQSHRDGGYRTHHEFLFAAAITRSRNTVSAVFFCASLMLS